MTSPRSGAHGVHMFTQTLTRRVRRSPLLELLTGPHGVDRYTELVDADLDAGDARAKVDRRASADPPQRHADAGTESRVHRLPRRAAHQPHRRDRRPSPHPAVLSGERRGRPLHRADHRPPRWRPGLHVPVRPRPPRHGRRPRLRGRRLHPPGRSAAANPVRLRRQRHHPGDVDAAHDARRRLRSRGRLHPLRTQRAGSLLRRRARRDARRPGAARLHPRDGRGDLTGHFDADHLAAAMPDPERGLRVRAARARGGGARALPGRELGELRPAGVDGAGRIVRRSSCIHRQRRRTSPTTAGRCSSRPRPQA